MFTFISHISLNFQLHCCGANDYMDWHDLKDVEWAKTHDEDVVPLSCCNIERNEMVCERASDNEVKIKANNRNGTLQIYEEVSYNCSTFTCPSEFRFPSEAIYNQPQKSLDHLALFSSIK